MYKNILVPVVLGEGHDHEASFAIARKLADDSARFTVLHVRETIPAYVAAQIPQEVLTSSFRESERDLQELSTGLAGSEPKLISGHAGQAIVDFAKAHEIDCIVIASHRPGLQNLFLGSTANRVVHQAQCSVHVLR